MESTIQKTPDQKTFTIKLPKLSGMGVQGAVLVLLIVVGLIQTVQLFGLRQAVASMDAKPAAVSAQSTSPQGGSASSLPTMVGGC